VTKWLKAGIAEREEAAVAWHWLVNDYDAVFSMRSVPRLYNEDQRDKLELQLKVSCGTVASRQRLGHRSRGAVTKQRLVKT
jgi:hypothetical protein